MKTQDYIAANKAAWNEAGTVHKSQTFARLQQSFAKPGFSCLLAEEEAIFTQLEVAGKSVLQLCCNNGRELLSIKNKGAKRVVGVDISEAFINQAVALAESSNIEAEFICADVYQVGEILQQKFDLIYCSAGAISWLPELDRFFKLVHQLLSDQGRLYLHEIHPMVMMFEPGDRAIPPRLQNSYFRSEPFCDEQGLDYIGQTQYDSKSMYEFQHTLSDIFSGCLMNELQVELFKEYPRDISGMKLFTETTVLPPLSYAFVAQKLPKRN